MALADLAFPGGFLQNAKLVEQALKRVNAWLSKATVPINGKRVDAWIPPSDWLLNAWVQGCLPDGYMRQALKAEMLNPSGLSTADLRWTTRFQDIITVRDPHDLAKNSGLAGFLLSQTATPSIVEAFILWNRDLIDEGVVDFIIRKSGIADPNIASALKDLRYQIPPNSDIIRWVVREAFNPALIKKYGYFEEVPTSARVFSKANGLGGPTGVMYPAGTDADGKAIPGGEATWFDMEWVAHWDLPSPGQGYEMLHRLYPKSDYGPAPGLNPKDAFTSVELQDLLKTADYPPYWRDKLMAISYAPLTRVDVRRMYQLGVLGKAAVYHAYRAIGYDDTNAKHLLNFTVKQTEVDEQNKQQLKAIPKICKAFQVGIASELDFAKYLDTVGVEAGKALEIVNQCKYERRIKHVEKMIVVIKRQYVKGILNRDDTIKQLNALGIILDRVMEYLDEWSLQLTVGVREVSAGEILKWYKIGMLDAPSAYDRLIHLGYEPNNATMMVGYASNEIAIQRAKGAKADAKAMQDRAKKETNEAKKAIKERQQTAKAKIKEAVIGASEKNLKTWLEEGEMEAGRVKAFLLLKGYSEELADKWIHSVERGMNPKED